MDNDKIYSSKSLKEEAERETGKSIIESNGGATRYSARDKSYSNLISFFIKVFKTEDEKAQTSWDRISRKEKVCISAKHQNK